MLSARTDQDAGPAGVDEQQWRQFEQQLASQVPAGRIGDAREVGRAAVFLACDDASFVNGIELFVDGGMAQI